MGRWDSSPQAPAGAPPIVDHPHVRLHYERVFPYPIDVAYAWLTDYQDDDPSRTGEIVRKRDVVRRTDREVEVEGELEVMGQRTHGRAVIHLFPEEKRWQAVIGKGGWIFDYRLVPQGASASRIVIDYKMGSRRWTRRMTIRLLKPVIRRRIDKMWDGFAASMDRELAAAPQAG